jgi:threonine aldolase
MIDLRSDTFTKPTSGMLEAIYRAEVGDDVFGEDPSVNTLESMVAGIFGMEAALFCPLGTMANQIAIKTHTRPGNEVICEQSSHVFSYEGGGIASNSGCQARTLPGQRGKLLPEQVLEAINNKHDLMKPKTTLVTVENTTNRGGGSCYTISELQDIRRVCDEYQLKLHLDGARIFNALVANGESPKDYGILFDSISVCLNKGLGAPIGSLLIGDADYILEARRHRKAMGGGMRQAGYMAAAGIYALEHHVDRLDEDHIHAKQLAEGLMKKPFIGKILPVETNILIFEVIDQYSPVTLTELFKQYGILCLPVSATQVRMVTHLDVSGNDIREVTDLLERL